MDRFLLGILALAGASLFAADPTLPKSIPPFALGDLCVASVTDHDGKATIEVEMYGWRSRNVETSDRIPVQIDGKLMYPDPLVRDTFSPTRQHSISSSPIDRISVWDRTGKKLELEAVTKLLATKKHAIILNRNITDADIGYLQYFRDDVIFIRLGRLTETLLKRRRQ